MKIQFMKNIFHRKILLLLPITIFVLSVNSCTSNDCTMKHIDAVQTTVRHFTIYHNDWALAIYDGVWDYGHWYCRLNIPAITIDVLNYGAVLVYYRDNLNNWVLLPYSTTWYNANGQLFTEEIWSGFALGTLDIDCVRTNPLNLTPISPLNIKVVIMRF